MREKHQGSFAGSGQAWEALTTRSKCPGKPNRKTSRRADGGRKSDQSIVLGDGCAVRRGEGLTGIRSLHCQHAPVTGPPVFGEGGPLAVKAACPTRQADNPEQEWFR